MPAGLLRVPGCTGPRGRLLEQRNGLDGELAGIGILGPGRMRIEVIIGKHGWDGLGVGVVGGVLDIGEVPGLDPRAAGRSARD